MSISLAQTTIVNLELIKGWNTQRFNSFTSPDELKRDLIKGGISPELVKQFTSIYFEKAPEWFHSSLTLSKDVKAAFCSAMAEKIVFKGDAIEEAVKKATFFAQGIETGEILYFDAEYEALDFTHIYSG